MSSPSSYSGLSQGCEDQKGYALLVLSLRTMVEESLAVPGFKNASGAIRSPDEVWRPENISKLEEHHQGLFAFLAFHPQADRAVLDYVKSGSLSSDAGHEILALFCLDADAKFPVAITDSSFSNWLEIDTSVHPSYELLRLLFPDESLAVPGIAFLRRLSVPSESIYVPLDVQTEAEVKSRLRHIFSFARQSIEDESFAASLGTKLGKAGLTYRRLGNISGREWLAKAFSFLKKNKGDIVSFIGLFT